jgi:hypothetical protein
VHYRRPPAGAGAPKQQQQQQRPGGSGSGPGRPAQVREPGRHAARGAAVPCDRWSAWRMPLPCMALPRAPAPAAHRRAPRRPPPPPPPDPQRPRPPGGGASGAGSGAAASAAGAGGKPNELEARLRRDTPFICNIRFKNDLPEIPAGAARAGAALPAGRGAGARGRCKP